jgi:hypothetical protein
MTTNDLVTHFQRYYQLQYEQYELVMVKNELDGHSDLYRLAASTVVLKHHSKVCRMLPGVAELTKYHDEILSQCDSIKKAQKESRPSHILDEAPTERLASDYALRSLQLFRDLCKKKTVYKDGQELDGE